MQSLRLAGCARSKAYFCLRFAVLLLLLVCLNCFSALRCSELLRAFFLLPPATTPASPYATAPMSLHQPAYPAVPRASRTSLLSLVPTRAALHLYLPVFARRTFCLQPLSSPVASAAFSGAVGIATVSFPVNAVPAVARFGERPYANGRPLAAAAASCSRQQQIMNISPLRRFRLLHLVRQLRPALAALRSEFSTAEVSSMQRIMTSRLRLSSSLLFPSSCPHSRRRSFSSSAHFLPPSPASAGPLASSSCVSTCGASLFPLCGMWSAFRRGITRVFSFFPSAFHLNVLSLLPVSFSSRLVYGAAFMHQALPHSFSLVRTSSQVCAAARPPQATGTFTLFPISPRIPPASLVAAAVAVSSLVRELYTAFKPTFPLLFAQLPATAVAAKRRAPSSAISPSPLPLGSTSFPAAPATIAATATIGPAGLPLWKLLYFGANALSQRLPSLMPATAQIQRHSPPQAGSKGGPRFAHDAAGAEGRGNEESSSAAEAGGAEAGDRRHVLHTPPAIRPRRRVPGRRSSPSWQQLFPDLRLVDLSLPATLHSALIDVNSVKYFELAVAQKLHVSRQLLDGVRMFDVRAWRDASDGRWYSEVPWRLEDDFRLLREHAPTVEDATTRSFVTSVLRSLPARSRSGGGKDRGRKRGEKRQAPGGGDAGGGGIRNADSDGNKKVPAKVLSLVDLHSWTSLEDGLFKPIQEFLRTHLSEVAVVVIASFNGNRKTAMNAMPHKLSLAASLRRLAARQELRQQDGVAAGSSSSRIEGYPFFEEASVEGSAAEAGAAAGADAGSVQQQQGAGGSGAVNSSASGAAAAQGGGGPSATTRAEGDGGAAGGAAATTSVPVLSSGALFTSPAYLDSLAASTAAYEVQQPLDTSCSFYMSSAVRKPLTYADVASFMSLVDTYWGQLLPRHNHAFFGYANESGRPPPHSSARAPAARYDAPAATAVPGVAGAPGVVGKAAAPGAAATGAAAQKAAVAGVISPSHPTSETNPFAATNAGQSATSFPLTTVNSSQVAVSSSPRFLVADLQEHAAAGAAAAPGTAAAAAAFETKGSSLIDRVTTSSAGATKDEAALATMVRQLAAPVAAVKGAAARATVTADPRAAAPQPAAAAGAATSSPSSAGGGLGATAAVFGSGYDKPRAVPYYSGEADNRPLAAGGAAAAAAAEAQAAATLLNGSSSMPWGLRSGFRGDYPQMKSSDARVELFPMYESLHRPETFAEWLRAQGDLLLATATIRELLDAKIRLLLFVDDPLIAWYLTVFSREHVLVFVAADHTYDVLYKSEALFAPCALPNRASEALKSQQLSMSREGSWADCRERCEATPGPLPRPEEARLEAKSGAARGKRGGAAAKAAARGAAADSDRSCTYWTFQPAALGGSLQPGISHAENEYSPLSSEASDLFPATSTGTSTTRDGSNSKRQRTQPENRSAAGDGALAGATSATPPADAAPLETKGECRTYAGQLTLADTVPVRGSIIQPRSCASRTLYELPTQWASSAVFADLTDAVCPIFEIATPPSLGVAGDAGADNTNGRAGTDGFDEGTGDSNRESTQKEPRSFQFLPELCMLDATPRSLRDGTHAQMNEGSGSHEEGTAQGNLERKLLRVYFSPPSPVPFVDGTRGGKREVGPVDAVNLMNELTATWALWQLERQQLVASLTVVDSPFDRIGAEDQTYSHSQWADGAGSGSVGGFDGSSSSSNGYYGSGYVDDPHLLAGRERPRFTRPVNALMVMRYDQTKSLIKNFSHLNYFEIIMNLNPQPRETRLPLFHGSDGIELSSDRYVKVTAILSSMDDVDWHSKGKQIKVYEVDFRTEEEKRDQAVMMWLAVCAAIMCILIVAVGVIVRSAFCSKRISRGGWTAADTSQRVAVMSDRSSSGRPLENLS